MLEKFKALAWHIQLIVLVGVAALLYLSVWYFITSGTRAEIQTLEDQIAQKISQNEAARIATQRINEFRSLYASKTQEYDELKVLLPEQREITNVLQGLQDTAGNSRLIMMRFSPREDSQQEGIMAKPVEVEVDSNFANLQVFFDKMAKLQRIVSITDFKLSRLPAQSGDRTLHSRFMLTAYYATPDDLTPKPAPDPKGAKPNDPNKPANANTNTAPVPPPAK